MDDVVLRKHETKSSDWCAEAVCQHIQIYYKTTIMLLRAWWKRNLHRQRVPNKLVVQTLNVDEAYAASVKYLRS